jgi:hypothetical protein
MKTDVCVLIVPIEDTRLKGGRGDVTWITGEPG